MFLGLSKDTFNFPNRLTVIGDIIAMVVSVVVVPMFVASIPAAVPIMALVIALIVSLVVALVVVAFVVIALILVASVVFGSVGAFGDWFLKNQHLKLRKIGKIRFSSNSLLVIPSYLCRNSWSRIRGGIAEGHRQHHGQTSDDQLEGHSLHVCGCFFSNEMSTDPTQEEWL